MKVDVHESASKSGKYVAVPASQSLAQAGVTDPDFSSSKPFKQGMDVNPGDKRIGVSSDQVIADIQSKGHAIFGAQVVTGVKPK